MADLTDVTAYLAQQAAAAIYPNGLSQPSVIGMDCKIFEGWPIAEQLDLDLTGFMMDPANGPSRKVPRPGGPMANVSVFPLQGSGVIVPQILDKTYIIAVPSVTAILALAGNTVTLTGTSSPGEFLTLVIDNAAVCSQSGSSTAAILNALAAEAVTKGYAASSTATTLTVLNCHALVARQGGKGILGRVVHKQRHSIKVTVWAPTQAARAGLSKPIDVRLKSTNRVTMPDTSQALVIGVRTDTIDELQTQSCYRRDLVFDVEYATVEQFDGFTITSTQTSITNPDNTAIAIATA